MRFPPTFPSLQQIQLDRQAEILLENPISQQIKPSNGNFLPISYVLSIESKCSTENFIIYPTDKTSIHLQVFSNNEAATDMLKIIYTDTGLHLELLTVDRQEWIAQRLKFARSVGEPMMVSKQRGTFLLPSPICEVAMVDSYLRTVGAKTVTVEVCDLDYVEIGLAGYWLATSSNHVEGIFVCQQTDRVESYLWQMWQSVTGQGFSPE